MKHKILIVDDEKSVANFLMELLELRGYEPVVYYDSKLAIEAFEADPHAYEVILTDQTMPGLTGAELAAKLISIRSDISIILCTGYSELVNEDIAEKIGIRYFMNKPVDIDDLLAKLDEIIASK